ncbi:MAG TPA: DEAD/DEAH box helicase [Burkholderiales bacterium]|nr:DEAD/DEAH box helicase [Burkholderiales bacterium]
MSNFDSLGLVPELLRAITDAGYTEPTPIQAQAIPVILSQKDVMGCAQTGTGKTAGFTLPLLQRLLPLANNSMSPARHPVRALIITPTRELAIQVADSVAAYGQHTSLRSTVVYGGTNIDPQTKALREGVEVLVATPGRLLDHVQQKSVNLSQVQILVLDEADRMLDMGFLPDITRILSLLPRTRQSLLFSATFSDDIKRLADRLLNQPVLIEVARRNAAAESVTHTAYEVDEHDKRAALIELLRQRGLQQVLVFSGTKHGANRLAQNLVRAGIEAAAIHSNKTQSARIQALDDFKQGKVRVLVATDIAARGIDIEELPVVINFNLPHVPEDYVHRIGRTGRAGKEGAAISLVGPDERRLLKNIEQLLKQPIPRVTLAGFDAGHEAEPAPRRAAARSNGSSRERTNGRRSEHKPGNGARRSAPRASTPRLNGQHRAPVASYNSDFDFDKPYEPADDAAAAPSPKQRPDVRRARKSQTAALLGGVSDKAG